MAKYIGTYANENAIASALTADELSRPFVALANDTKRVYYGEYADIAQVGDIVVYDSARTSLRFIHFADYNTTTYPTASYEPVGVVCEDQVISLAGSKSDVKMLSLNWMDKENPDTGNASRQNLEWGDTSVTTNAASTTDGKANTELVLTFATGQNGWHTASTISYTDGERMFPLFECAWRYHTNGTNQGDWYIGAKDELNPLVIDSPTNEKINDAFTLLSKSSYSEGGETIGSSTEFYDRAFFYWGDGTWGSLYSKDKNTCWGSRALYSGTILQM